MTTDSRKQQLEAFELELRPPRMGITRQFNPPESVAMSPFTGGSRALKALDTAGMTINIMDIGFTAEERRLAVVEDPDILLTLLEQGWTKIALTVMLGLPNVSGFNKFVKRMKLEEPVHEAIVSSADFFAELAATSYESLESTHDNVQALLDHATMLTMASTGNVAALNAIRCEFPEASDDELAEIILSRSRQIDASMAVISRGAETIGKIADRRFKGAMQQAANRNAQKYGTASNGAGAGNNATQNVVFNLDFGNADTKSIKVINPDGETSSLPSGLDFG